MKDKHTLLIVLGWLLTLSLCASCNTNNENASIEEERNSIAIFLFSMDSVPVHYVVLNTLDKGEYRYMTWYEIGMDGDDIRWDDIDEDIHISSFFVTAEPDTDNPIAEVFRRFPQLNVSEVARSIGINKSLLSRYIYGIKKPSEQRKEQIINCIRQLGRKMAAI